MKQHLGNLRQSISRALVSASDDIIAVRPGTATVDLLADVVPDARQGALEVCLCYPEFSHRGHNRPVIAVTIRASNAGERNSWGSRNDKTRRFKVEGDDVKNKDGFIKAAKELAALVRVAVADRALAALNSAARKDKADVTRDAFAEASGLNFQSGWSGQKDEALGMDARPIDTDIGQINVVVRGEDSIEVKLPRMTPENALKVLDYLTNEIGTSS